LAELLGAYGHSVRTALDGQEAVDLAASEPPDVALLDIGMPRLDGYQVAQRLRVSCPDTLLVAVTAWGDADDKRRATAAGFHHHFVKPADLNRILQLLDSVHR
jgi:CheY-like chemotaxis protein